MTGRSLCTLIAQARVGDLQRAVDHCLLGSRPLNLIGRPIFGHIDVARSVQHLPKLECRIIADLGVIFLAGIEQVDRLLRNLFRFPAPRVMRSKFAVNLRNAFSTRRWHHCPAISRWSLLATTFMTFLPPALLGREFTSIIALPGGRGRYRRAA